MGASMGMSNLAWVKKNPVWVMLTSTGGKLEALVLRGRWIFFGGMMEPFWGLGMWRPVWKMKDGEISV